MKLLKMFRLRIWSMLAMLVVLLVLASLIYMFYATGLIRESNAAPIDGTVYLVTKAGNSTQTVDVPFIYLPGDQFQTYYGGQKLGIGVGTINNDGVWSEVFADHILAKKPLLKLEPGTSLIDATYFTEHKELFFSVLEPEGRFSILYKYSLKDSRLTKVSSAETLDIPFVAKLNRAFTFISMLSPNGRFAILRAKPCVDCGMTGEDTQLLLDIETGKSRNLDSAIQVQLFDDGSYTYKIFPEVNCFYDLEATDEQEAACYKLISDAPTLRGTINGI